MSNLYLELNSGASGDMLVACLLGFDDDVHYLRNRLKLIALTDYEIRFFKEKRNGIKGSRFEVIVKKRSKYRNYSDIISLIDTSSLEENEKKLSKKIFRIIAEAEAKIHDTKIEAVHFHEIGLTDSIVDVAAFSILLNKFDFKKIYCSPVPLGKGNTESLHSKIPIPSPATAEILKGAPVYGTGIDVELTTPTGAGILKAVVDKYCPLPNSVIKNISYSFGKRETPGINILRGYIFEDYYPGPSYLEETIVSIECTVDDSTPEEIGYLQNKLFENGALDVYFSPVFMKKNRPGWNIIVIATPEVYEKLCEVLLYESSSFGIRYSFLSRKILKRKIIKVNTEFGEINVKIGFIRNKIAKLSPEYEDCRKIAEKERIPIREVMFYAREVAEKELKDSKIREKPEMEI